MLIIICYRYIRIISMKRFFLSVVLILTTAGAFAQQAEFCEAVTAILRDAPNGFKNIRGNQLKGENGILAWQTGILVPGTIGSRFVSAMGLFYEGAFFQSPAITHVGAYYEKVKNGLNICLSPLGYKMSLTDNFSPGMSDYKKVLYMLEPTANDLLHAKVPAHVTLEALYNKDAKQYTVVMYIFEN